MKIFRSLTLVFLLFCGSIAHAAHVQSNGVWDDSGDAQSTFGLAFSSNVTSGNLMIAATRFHDDITPTVSDTLSSTWTLGQRIYNAGQGAGIIWYWAIAAGTGANTATFSFSPAQSQVRIALLEESGIAAVSPIDASNGSVDFWADTSTDAVTSGTFTTTVSNARVVGIAIPNGAITLAGGTGFTLHVGSTAIRTWIETRTVATAGSTSATFTMASSTSIGGIVGIALKPAVGGGGGVANVHTLQNINKTVGPHKAQQLGGILEGH